MSDIIDLNIHTSMVNEWDHFTIQGYEDLFMQVLEYHLYRRTTEKMKEDRIHWVLMSMAVEVHHYFQRGEHLRAEIYDSGFVGKHLVRKEIGFYRKGQLMMTAVAFMGLMDLNIRKLYRGPLEDYCGAFSFGEQLMEADSRINVDFDLQEAHVHDVLIQPSCIDALGHCNNERYFAMIYNSLDEEHQSMTGFRRLEMSFVHEVRKFEKLQVYRINAGETCEIQGIREDGRVSFMARMYYDKN